VFTSDLLPNAVLMIRPAAFGFNPQTAASNAFQQASQQNDVRKRACEEFDALHKALEEAEVEVLLLADTAHPPKPDAVFPNNWFSHQPDGSLVFYPMEAENRRLERRNDLPTRLREEGFPLNRVLDLSYFEKEQLYLEGTGSLVFDYKNKIAYAARSSRTHAPVLQTLCRALGYTPFLFQAADQKGLPVYHTNVLLTLGLTFALACLDAFQLEGEKYAFQNKMEANGKTLIPISFEQMNSFAGNMFQLINRRGKRVLVVSETAWRSLNDPQRHQLGLHTDAIVLGRIPTIEQLGGGSVRCMLAGLWRSPVSS
jgi:hypothetical protein